MKFIKLILEKTDLNKLLILSGVIALCFIGAFFIWWRTDINIINSDDNATTITDHLPKSNITGMDCENPDQRPVAVMIASDPITRPLSGIGQADMVFEMPVTPNGITRMMTVFQCDEPEDIGSVRSAREDFIPLAASLGAVYVHWGGEREALKKLNGHILDNIDAMIYENKYFYRKSGVKQPHDGFTDFKMLWRATKDLGYGTQNTFTGYPHTDKIPTKNIANIADSITIDHPSPFNILWAYDQDSNSYKRMRNGTSEIDKNTGQQVLADVVIVMETTSKYISIDYVNINVVGRGKASIYQNGVKISGEWEKDSSRLDSKLFFYDTEDREIEFAPGKIWVEIVVKN